MILSDILWSIHCWKTASRYELLFSGAATYIDPNDCQTLLWARDSKHRFLIRFVSRTFLSRTYKVLLLLKLRSILLWFVKWLSFGNTTCDLCAGRCKVSPCSSLSSQMAFGIGRRVSAPLLGLNFALYLITACIAGWTLNHNIDASVSTKHGSYIGRSIMSFYTPLNGVSYYYRPSFFFLFFVCSILEWMPWFQTTTNKISSIESGRRIGIYVCRECGNVLLSTHCAASKRGRFSINAGWVPSLKSVAYR